MTKAFVEVGWDNNDSVFDANFVFCYGLPIDFLEHHNNASLEVNRIDSLSIGDNEVGLGTPLEWLFDWRCAGRDMSYNQLPS